MSVSLFGRNEIALKQISAKTQTPYSTTELEKADLYLICVKDSAIEEVSRQIPFVDAIVAHTSGSVSREVLEGKFRKAVFYPLQTFSKDKELDYREIPIFLDAAQDEDLEILKNLAKQITTKVGCADDEKRKYIHLTAVFACNFVNHLFARAKEISDSQEIPFTYFLPLIDETVEKIKSLDPKIAQTGPAIRQDQRVLALHEALLKGEPLKIYKLMNESIKKMYEN